MKTIFKTLFGISEDVIQKRCVIMPFDIPKAAEHLGVAALIKGRLFSVAQGQGLTLIRSGMGAGFVGDCVLWLKETPCRELLFLGTCGLVARKPGLNIGTVVSPSIIHAFESFSQIAAGDINAPLKITADQQFIERMPPEVARAGCISFTSLHEESQHKALFRKLGADVIEMECAAFFTAAKKIGRASSALLVISDILGDADLCFKLSPKNKTSLANGVSQACQMIRAL